MSFMLKFTLSLNLYYKWRILRSKSKIKTAKANETKLPKAS